MRKQIFIMWNYTQIGGIESLILRLSKTLINRNYEVVFGCNTYDEVKNTEYINNLLNMGVQVVKIDKIKNDCITDMRKFKKYNFNNIDELTIIVFNYDEYFLAQNIKYKNTKCKINILFYVVHPFIHTCRDLNINFDNKIIRKAIKLSYKYMMQKLYNNNILYFMDENCIKYNEKYYSLDLHNAYNQIIRLPINVGVFNDRKLNKDNNEFNILTIARLDFPFKGYIIGLIKDISKLKVKYSNISLTIIGDGINKQQMLYEVDKLDEDIKRCIKITGTVEYKNLGYYFENAKLYLGMGTTVLDAINHGIPAIVIHSYTYENIATGFFYENPNILGQSEICVNALDLIEKVINMSDLDYLDICYKDYNALKKMYDIDNVVDIIVNVENNDRKAISNFFMNFLFLSRSIGIALKKKFKK